MIFTEPLPFSDALRELAEKALLPTDMSTAELRALDAEVRNTSVFMARVTKAEFLQGLKDQLAEGLAGSTNKATMRARLQDQLDAMEYTAEGGFPDETSGRIPPAEEGSLRDIKSDQRLNLVLTTNLRLIGNRGFQRAGQTDFALYAWPCYELVRVGVREVPRGMKRVRGKKGAQPHLVEDFDKGWPARWERCGGRFYHGRMIARKDDPIWNELGSSKEFSDALDTDVPPFAFNSGMGWRAVRREECVRLGVITADTDIQGRKSERDRAIETAAKLDPEFLKSIRDRLDVEIADGKARIAKAAQLSAASADVAPKFDFNLGGKS